MRRQDKPKREPRRAGLADLAPLSSAPDIVCLRCNEERPRAGAEPFRSWGYVCTSCAKQLRAIDQRALVQGQKVAP